MQLCRSDRGQKELVDSHFLDQTNSKQILDVGVTTVDIKTKKHVILILIIIQKCPKNMFLKMQKVPFCWKTPIFQKKKTSKNVVVAFLEIGREMPFFGQLEEIAILKLFLILVDDIGANAQVNNFNQFFKKNGVKLGFSHMKIRIFGTKNRNIRKKSFFNKKNPGASMTFSLFFLRWRFLSFFKKKHSSKKTCSFVL